MHQSITKWSVLYFVSRSSSFAWILLELSIWPPLAVVCYSCLVDRQLRWNANEHGNRSGQLLQRRWGKCIIIYLPMAVDVWCLREHYNFMFSNPFNACVLLVLCHFSRMWTAWLNCPWWRSLCHKKRSTRPSAWRLKSLKARRPTGATLWASMRRAWWAPCEARMTVALFLARSSSPSAAISTTTSWFSRTRTMALATGTWSSSITWMTASTTSVIWARARGPSSGWTCPSSSRTASLSRLELHTWQWTSSRGTISGGVPRAIIDLAASSSRSNPCRARGSS